MNAAALLLAAVLAAPPFPPPRVAQASPALKCDRGTVTQVDAARGELRVATTAGTVTYRIGPDVQAFDREGKPAGAATGLVAGARVRVYYVVEDGARAQELALE